METAMVKFFEKRAEVLLKNLKSRHFDAYYCHNKEEALEKANSLTRCVYGAPLCLMLAYNIDETYPYIEDKGLSSGDEDCSIVATHIMFEAMELGLGSCWIHRAWQTFETQEGKELLRSWGLKDTLVGIGNCILGYPDEEPEARPRLEGRIVKVG